jgi:hypothetical protein
VQATGRKSTPLSRWRDSCWLTHELGFEKKGFYRWLTSLPITLNWKMGRKMEAAEEWYFKCV